MLGRPSVTIAGLALMLAACSDRAAPVPQGSPPPRRTQLETDPERPGGCPAQQVVRGFHAAAFHFEHGRPQLARAQLEQARAALPQLAEHETGAIFGALRQLSESYEADAQAATLAAERIRVQVSEWRCLTEALHRRLHEQLESSLAEDEVEPGRLPTTG